MMKLSNYQDKYVRATDIYGKTHTGIADYFPSEYCLHEYGEEEDCLVIGGFLVYASQFASIEKIVPHGTAELRTERLILRRYRPDDALSLCKELGSDPVMVQYSGWNPYATEEMARDTVNKFISSYEDEHFYGWVIDFDDALFGTIGAYDFHDNQIEVGFSIARACWGRGYATEALKKVLEYLTENEGISCVTAWCASENMGSRRVLEKAGMRLVKIEKDGVKVGARTYEKLGYEYRR